VCTRVKVERDEEEIRPEMVINSKGEKERKI
jgi:hypothetical protein